MDREKNNMANGGEGNPSRNERNGDARAMKGNVACGKERAVPVSALRLAGTAHGTRNAERAAAVQSVVCTNRDGNVH